MSVRFGCRVLYGWSGFSAKPAKSSASRILSSNGYGGLVISISLLWQSVATEIDLDDIEVIR
jgi:hypothetical protein